MRFLLQGSRDRYSLATMPKGPTSRGAAKYKVKAILKRPLRELCVAKDERSSSAMMLESGVRELGTLGKSLPHRFGSPSNV